MKTERNERIYNNSLVVQSFVIHNGHLELVSNHICGWCPVVIDVVTKKRKGTKKPTEAFIQSYAIVDDSDRKTHLHLLAGMIDLDVIKSIRIQIHN